MTAILRKGQCGISKRQSERDQTQGGRRGEGRLGPLPMCHLRGTLWLACSASVMLKEPREQATVSAGQCECGVCECGSMGVRDAAAQGWDRGLLSCQRRPFALYAAAKLLHAACQSCCCAAGPGQACQSICHSYCVLHERAYKPRRCQRVGRVLNLDAQACRDASTHTRMHTYAQGHEQHTAHMHARARTDARTHVRTHTREHTHTHMHARTRTHKCTSSTQRAHTPAQHLCPPARKVCINEEISPGPVI